MTGSTTALLTNGPTNTAYDANDRIIGHTYDANGSETTVNGQLAGYDFENHLVSLGSVAGYVYDADGNRYSVSNVGTTTSYTVDTSLPYASVVEEYSNGSLAARYDYGDDLVRMDRGSGVYYYIYDGLGSTRQLVSTSGTVTDSYGYSAFGELASHTGSTINPFLFNAQQFDGASGDYYLRARYYDQSNGRFISQDPFGGFDADPTTLHRYLYANNDPMDRFDPTGRFTEGEVTLASGQSQVFDAISSGAALTYAPAINSVAVAGAQFMLAFFVAGPAVVLTGAAVVTATTPDPSVNTMRVQLQDALANGETPHTSSIVITAPQKTGVSVGGVQQAMANMYYAALYNDNEVSWFPFTQQGKTLGSVIVKQAKKLERYPAGGGTNDLSTINAGNGDNQWNGKRGITYRVDIVNDRGTNLRYKYGSELETISTIKGPP